MENFLSHDNFKNITDKFSAANPLLVVGDIGVDKYTQGEVTRISPEAPVPVLEVQKEWFKLGLAANVCDNLSSLGASSVLCGVAGDDQNCNLLEKLLKDVGHKTQGIIRSEQRKTTLKERVTTKAQQICRIDYETGHQLTSSEFDNICRRIEELDGSYSAIILQDYGKGTLTKELIEYLRDYASKKSLTTLLDPNTSSDPLNYKGLDLIKPNFKEGMEMISRLRGKTYNIADTVVALSQELEISKVLMTLGPEGMAIFDKDISSEVTIIPTVANEVFDVSGAGDTVISTIALTLQAGASLLQAAWLANCSAGVVIAKVGTACVTVQELSEFYNRLALSFSKN